MSRITSLLLAGVALLAVILAALWLGPEPLAAWRAWSPPAPQAPNLDDVQTALLKANPAATAAYPAIMERPLFQPSRRLEAAASAPAAAAPPPTAIEQIKLLGLISGADLTGVMLEEQGQQRFVRRGEKVGDWTLDAIEERFAVFTRDGERKQIELPYTYVTQPKDAAAPAGAKKPGAPPASGPAHPEPFAPPSALAVPKAAPASAPTPAHAPAPAAPAPMPKSAPAAKPAPAAAPASAPAASFGGRARPQPSPPKESGVR